MEKTNTKFSTRCIAMLLTVLTLVSGIPLSMIEVSAKESLTDEYPIMPMANPGSSNPSADMTNNKYLDALAGTGYNVSKQRSDKTLFVTGYYAGGIKKKIDNGEYPNILSGIKYAAVSGNDGLATRNKQTGEESATGKVPDIDKMKTTGLECGGYATYVFMNYMPNVKGVTYDGLAEAMKYVNQENGMSSDGTESPVIWYHTLQRLVSQGKAERLSFKKPIDFSLIGKVDTGKTTGESGFYDIDYIDWSTLRIGDIIIFGTDENYTWSSITHIGIYAGTCNSGWTENAHFMTHVGNSRGPEITEVRYMAEGSGSKTSVPVAVYRLQEVQDQPGKLQITKSSPNGGGLGGWQFTIYSDSACKNAVATITTNASGIATSGDLDPGTYYVKETGPNKDTDYWTMDASVKTVEVKAGETATTTTSGADLTFTNYGYGRLKIQKYSPNGGGLGGWEFTIYTNSTCTTVATFSDGTKAENLKTNASGVYTTGKLKPGTYWIKETGPAKDSDYWVLDDSPKQVTVALGSTTTVEFYNYGYGRLKIQKYCPNGGGVGGWEFTIYTNSTCTTVAEFNDGTKAENLKTNSSGVYTTGKLKPGTYWIKETGPAKDSEYWVLDNEPKQVTISIGSTTTVEFYNYQYGKLKIIKTSTNGGTVEGWQFTIYSDSDCETVVGTYTTGADGTITTEQLIPGTYYVKETGAPSGIDTSYWTIDSEVKTVTVAVSRTAEVSFANKFGGNAQITKTSTNGGTVAGWEFTVYSDSACSKVVAVITTDTNGIATVRGLDPGTYWIKETSAPSGVDTSYWTMDSSVKTVTVTVGSTATVSFENEFYGKAQITKTTVNSSVREGWQFTVYRDAACTDVVATLTTDSRGIATTGNLDPGTYWVKETGYPAGTDTSYWVMDTAVKSVSVKAGETAAVSFTNELCGKAQIVKTSTFGGTVEGWEFGVYSDEACTRLVTTIITDQYGVANTGNIAPGRYYVKEIGAPKGLDTTYWTMDDEVKSVVVTAGQTATISFENRWYGRAQIIKTSTGGGTVEGWIFAIYSDSSCTKAVGGYVTDKDGIITTDKLEPGTYYVKEIGAPNGLDTSYWEMDSEVKSVTVTAGSTATVSFENRYGGKAQITKTSTNGGTVAGWEFTVYSDSDCTTVVTTIKTNSRGIAISSCLTPGTYYVKETAAPIGVDISYWEMDSEVKTVTVTAGSTATVSFTNEFYGKAEIVKTATNGGTVEGWKFAIYRDENCTDLVGTYITDRSGRITTDKLEPGTYYVKETGAPDEVELSYWTMDDDVKAVTVTAGIVETVSFTNELYGKAQIIKTSTFCGTVEGWEFTIYRDENCTDFVGTYITDGNGRITTGKLAPGMYYVIETAAPSEIDMSYWTMDSEVKSVTVTAGKTASVSFENRWYGRVVIIKNLENPEEGTLDGWTFEIRDSDGNLVGTYVTEIDGVITTDNLEPGVYTVTEILEEDSLWVCISENPQTVTVTAGQTMFLSFHNALCNGKITVEKTDDTGNFLAGAQFLLEWSLDGDTWQPVSFSGSEFGGVGGCTSEGLTDGILTVGHDGAVVFEGLSPLAYYRLTEVIAPDGYQLLTSPVFVGQLEADNEYNLSFRVVNYPLPTLPSTGSHELMFLPPVAIALALCGLILILRKKRKHGTV